MIIDELFEDPQQCPECGGISFSDLILAEKKDACYHKVKASAKVWPSAYASGRLVQCRKKGAANYGNKSESMAETRVGQVPMTLKPGETDDLEPEDFEGFKQLPEYLEGQKAQQKAGKDLIQQSPYTYQSDQDWAYRNGAFDQRQAASSADFTKRGPLTTEQGLSEEESEEESERRRFPNYYHHKDKGTVFRVQSPGGKTTDVHPGDEKWDNTYQKKYKGMPTPNDGGFWSDDDTAAMVEETEDMAESWRDIYNLNKQKIGTNPNLIKTDTVLKMPDGSRYKVKPGDNLSSIAKTSGTKSTPAKSNNLNTKSAVEPKYYSLPPDAATTRSFTPPPAKTPAAQDDSPYVVDPRSGQAGVKPDRIADVFRNTELPPSLTRDEIEQQMMQPDLAGPASPGFRHTVQGPEGKEYDFDSEPEARDFVDRIKQLDIKDRESQGLGAAKSESIRYKKGMAEEEGDGFDDITTFSDKRTTDRGGKTNQTYTSTTIAKNPTTGQQQSLGSWDHTDPKTGKNYSGTNYIDPQGNAHVQKNYKESKKIKVDEVSLGKYREKATVDKARAQANKFFGRDDPATVAAADQTIAKRERGLGRADARRRPYTAPPVDKEKQRQQLTDKYPNIDELVRRAEVNRDPNYEYADGQAYYDGQEAEQKYQQLKKIQRIIQGLNEETRQATVNTPAGDFTANITKDKNTNTVSGTMPVGGATLSAKKDLTPGGAQSVTVDTDVAPNLNLSATRKSADYNKGQLAGTKSVSAKYTDTTGALGKPGQQHTATRTAGVGFGGASGARVGKNYVTQIDKTLSDYMDEAKGINSIRNPNDLQPLEAGGGMGGGGGRTTSGPSPFGPKPGSREASIAQPNANTMTVRQGPNPDYVPPKTLQQKYDELNKKLDQLPPAPPVKVPRPGRAAADKRQTDQAQAAELKDVVPLSPAERNQLRPVDANKVRQSELNKEPPDLSSVRPGRDYKEPSNWDSVRPGLDEQSVAPATNASTLRSAQGQAAGTAPQGLTPQQQTAFAPHLKTDNATGSQYYDTPDTDPKEVGAMMGTKITTPAAQALVKSPQGQAGVIKHLTAVTDPKNAVNPSTTTTTPMSPADAAAAVPDSQPTSEDMHRLQELSGLTNKDIEEQSRKKQPPEEKYGPEYDDMVARVKKLAGLGPLKTVYDPNKRVYKNVPTAQQPKK
jgi:LysM repeat protein